VAARDAVAASRNDSEYGAHERGWPIFCPRVWFTRFPGR
jgi:hypothetical protein